MKFSATILALCATVCLAAPQQKKEEMLTSVGAPTEQKPVTAQQIIQSNEAAKRSEAEAARSVEAQQHMQNIMRSGYGGGYGSQGAIGIGGAAAGFGGPGAIGIFPGASAAPCQIPFMVSCSPTIIRGNTLSPCAHSAYAAAAAHPGYGAVSAPAYRDNSAQGWSGLDQQQLQQQQRWALLSQMNEQSQKSALDQQNQQNNMQFADSTGQITNQQRGFTAGSFVPEPVKDLVNHSVQGFNQGFF